MAKTQKRDWSSMLPELLNAIAKNLSEISDFVRFRSVCTSWRFSTPLTDLPPQFPWIFMGKTASYPDKGALMFYSIPSRKIHTIRAPNIANKMTLLTSVEGHLLVHPIGGMFSWRKFSLLNPLNNEEIFLPTFDFYCSPSLVGYQKNTKADNWVCCGFVDYNMEHKLVLCSFGQDNWTQYKLESHNDHCKYFYLMGMMFTVERDTGVTKVKDVASGSFSYSVPPVEGPIGEEYILLVDISGDIFRVAFHYHSRKKVFDIHRMDGNESGSRHWVKVESIGNYALFIHRVLSNCFAIRANDSSEIEANYIYTLNDEYSEFVVEKINIKTNARERLPYPSKRGECWFVPNLHHF